MKIKSDAPSSFFFFSFTIFGSFRYAALNSSIFCCNFNLQLPNPPSIDGKPRCKEAQGRERSSYGESPSSYHNLQRMNFYFIIFSQFLFTFISIVCDVLWVFIIKSTCCRISGVLSNFPLYHVFCFW